MFLPSLLITLYHILKSKSTPYVVDKIVHDILAAREKEIYFNLLYITLQCVLFESFLISGSLFTKYSLIYNL